MSYPYFFKDSSDIRDGRFFLTGQDYYHLANVLRGKTGDNVQISDNERYRYRASIGEITKNQAELIIRDKRPLVRKEPGITLFQCILKRNAMEIVIQKAAEIGADVIVPIYSRRVVPDGKKASGKLDRWQKIADEASRQCKRDFRCSILPPIEIFDIKVDQYDIFYLPYENARKNRESNPEIITGIKSCANIAFLTGPEGGFETDEILGLEKKGAIQVSLGNNILRAETASIYFLSVIDFLTGG